MLDIEVTHVRGVFRVKMLDHNEVYLLDKLTDEIPTKRKVHGSNCAPMHHHTNIKLKLPNLTPYFMMRLLKGETVTISYQHKDTFSYPDRF